MIRERTLRRPSCRASTGEPPCVTCPVRSHNICRPLDQRRQAEFYENRRTWEKGRLLYRAGDPLGPIFKIITGIVSVSKRLPDGRRQILDFFFPGEICGYSEEDGLYAFEGEAVTPVEVCVFGRARFKTFTAAHADLTEIVRATLVRKLNSVSRHLAELGQLSSTEKVAAFLCWLSARCEEHGMETQPLLLPMSREVIGDYLGLRIETVSRAFSRLRCLNLIKASETEATILDYPRLAAFSGSDNLR
jgi:CRP/FNR family transcriptional regulator